MVFNRQRCKAQTEAERSTASTGQSAPRSGIKNFRPGGIAASPVRPSRWPESKLTYNCLMTGASVHQGYKCETPGGDVLPAGRADG